MAADAARRDHAGPQEAPVFRRPDTPKPTLPTAGHLSPVLEAPVADRLTGPVAFVIDSVQQIGGTGIRPVTPS